MDIYQQVQAFYQQAKTQKTIIGQSVFGRAIYAVRFGHGWPVGIATYAIHGREFITARLSLEQYLAGVCGSMWFVPIVNPDGALLSQIGLDSAPKSQRKRLTALNGGKKDFRLWKANGNGVDLNVNFDADWGKGAQNVFTAGAENYVGAYAFSEPESRALKDFTLQVRPDYTISYHTKGEEIYWYFGQETWRKERDEKLAKCLSQATMYPLKSVLGSVGGYKDWCISQLQIPAFTVEVGLDEWQHPLTDVVFGQINEKNKFALRALSQAVKEMRKE